MACNLGRGGWIFPAEPGAELLAASDAGIGRAPGGVLLPPDTVAILAGMSLTRPPSRFTEPSTSVPSVP